MAHALGLRKTNKSAEALPHILSPVFVKNNQGIIEPRNLIWPSYWAVLDSTGIQPIPQDIFISVARPIIAHLDSTGNGDWPQIADSTLAQVLDSLKTGIKSGQPVYVSSGFIYSLNADSHVVKSNEAVVQPYSWPIAHDVRPARQALGSNGCNDCHSTSSAFYFGQVKMDTPLINGDRTPVSMTHFLDENTLQAEIFSLSFFFRPWLKYLMFFCSFILIAVSVLYGFKGLSRLMILTSLDQKKRK